MKSATSANPIDGRAEPTARRRKRFPAVSGVHLLIVATGVLALVANLALLRRGEAPSTRMAVTTVDLVPGRHLQPDDIELVPMDVAEPVAAGLITESDLVDFQGWVVAARTASGTLLSKASLRAPLTRSDFRAMSFPIDPEHAAGGDLVPGDLVDVIRVDEEEASFVATGVTVLDVPGESGGALGLSGSFYLILEVDDRTALTLALALANADVEVLRSTGAGSVNVQSLQDRRSISEEDSPAVGQVGPAYLPPPSSGGLPPIGGGLWP
ncbi:MAG: hypothetical protein OXC98_09805 [bacterium]|nr:hypothetical protein [Acidimicrobiia bacterium]MCY4650644.1 hypothetical protein [bacterium]